MAPDANLVPYIRITMTVSPTKVTATGSDESSRGGAISTNHTNERGGCIIRGCDQRKPLVTNLPPDPFS